MMLFWFVIGVVAVVVVLVVLLLVQQHRTRDFGQRIDPRDVPGAEFNDAQSKASVASVVRRGGSGPFW